MNKFSVGTYELGPLIGIITVISHEITQWIDVNMVQIHYNTSSFSSNTIYSFDYNLYLERSKLYSIDAKLYFNSYKLYLDSYKL